MRGRTIAADAARADARLPVGARRDFAFGPMSSRGLVGLTGMRLTLTEFVTLDGVYQGPGGPTEDPSGDFGHGGWLVPFFDDALSRYMEAIFADVDAFVLGRKTYEIFAASWPKKPRAPRGRRELVGELAHRQRLEPFAVGEVDGSAEHPLLAQRRRTQSRLRGRQPRCRRVPFVGS